MFDKCGTVVVLKRDGEGFYENNEKEPTETQKEHNAARPANELPRPRQARNGRMDQLENRRRPD